MLESIYVIIATKGRPSDIPNILKLLESQSKKPSGIVVVGAEEADFGGTQNLSLNDGTKIEFLVADTPGLTRQRNLGIECVLAMQGPDDDFGIVYFDDDFRPHEDWLHEAASVLGNNEVVGVSGLVLADGINGPGISEECAVDYLSGKISPEPHFSRDCLGKSIGSVYGCNMAFTGEVSRKLRFDESLPAYAWQEDRDYTGQTSVFGRSIVVEKCKGVHLGTKNGRGSGVKFGYSQIANPLFLASKGTMPKTLAMKFIIKNCIANHLKAIFPERWIDRKGRAIGNWLALRDVCLKRLSPSNISTL